MNVASLMTSPARTCNQEDSLQVAAAIMWEADCGALPVVDEEGRLVGIITDRDVCMTAYLRGVAFPDCSVGSAMTRAIGMCHAEDCLDEAQGTMRALQVRRLPVVDADGRPVGILSINDLALAAPSAENGRLGMRKESVLATLTAISQHRSQHRAHDPA